MPHEVVKTRKIRKKSLVVGGAGFIGSHVCEALIAQDQNVICLDDLETGTTENISLLQKSPHFTFIEANINSFDFSAIGPVEYVYHLAALDAYLTEIKPSIETLITNSVGTKNLLDFALSAKAIFLYASTIDVYAGVASSLSLNFYYGRTEEDESRFSHHEAKRFGEAMVMEYQNKYHLNARIVRLTDVYGPRMPLESADVLNAILTQAFTATKIILPNDGLQILHPTFISDVVYGIQRAALLEETNGSIYYLANPQEIEAKTVAEQCMQIMGSDVKIEYEKSEELLFPPAKIEIEKSKEELRWEPKVSVEEGLRFTADYFKKGDADRAQPGETTLSVKTLMGQPLPYSEHETHQPDRGKEQSRSMLQSLFGAIGHSKPRAISTLFEPQSITPKKLTAKPSSEKQDKAKETKENTQSDKRTEAGKYVKLFFIAASLILVFGGVVAPAFLSAVFTYRGVTRMQTAKEEFMELNLSDARKSLTEAGKSLELAYANVDNLTWLATLFHLRGYSQDALYMLSAGMDVSAALLSVSRGVEPLVVSARQILSDNPQQTNDFQEISREAATEYALSLEKLAEAQALLDKVNADKYPGFLADKVHEINSQLVFVRQTLDSAGTINRMMPTLIGQNEDKVYLVLFQNNMERRATGGFIGSYARISLKKGTVDEIRVDDIYNPDGQIKGQFAPPEELKKYLGVADYGMRDANWSPDFTLAAQDEMMLYEAATKEQVDGITSMDLYFVADLLRLLGPITLAENQETITADNLFQKAEYHAEVNYEEGSSNKKDFLGDLGFEMLNEIRNLSADQWGGLVKTLKTGLDGKHLLLYFSEPALQELALEQNWAGAAQTREGDYIWVVDSNVGANKSDYFVTRSTDYNLTIGKDGDLQAKVVLTYVHNGTSDAWPGGTYKDYLRVYAPKGSALTSWENFVDAPAAGEELGHAVFSGYFEVAVGSTKSITLQYDLPDTLKITDSMPTYSLLGQKQSGSRNEMFTLNISFPQYLDVSEIATDALVQTQNLTIRRNFDTDQKITITFRKK